MARNPPDERAQSLRRLASALRRRRDDLALVATREMGKPLAQSHGSLGLHELVNAHTIVVEKPTGPTRDRVSSK